MVERVGSGEQLRVLVVGGGAREHALARALSASPTVERVYVAPGNPGMARVAKLVPIGVSDVFRLHEWALENVDFVVIGPEAPIADGLASMLRDEEIAPFALPVFAPSRSAAQLEWSKAFAKRFMADHGIPTAGFAVFDNVDDALGHLATAPLPLVVKADGLAGGKGVWVCHDREEAERAVRSALEVETWEEPRVVIEEFLEGVEASVMALVDGERIAVLPPARDHKRLGDGDTGPNTGGMGAYAPIPDLDRDALAEIERTILRPTVDGLRAMGRPYIGVLYAGLMLTADGPKVLEFNCRFGDPEAQVVLPLLEGDLAQILLACARGRLDPEEVRWRDGAAACVVLAAGGYPGKLKTGVPITGVPQAERTGATVLHAGTAEREGRLVVSGGRVVSVVGEGATVAEAVDRAYAAADLIRFQGRQMRHDIGRAEVPV